MQGIDEPKFYQYIFIYLKKKNTKSRKTYEYNFSEYKHALVEGRCVRS